MPYKFLDHIATADCAVEIYGDTVEEVFSLAAEALTSAMTYLSSVKSELEWKVELKADGLTELFYAWLAELIYLKDVESALFSGVRDCTIDRESCCSVKATLTGERIDYSKHDISVDVKAVTMYRFELTEAERGWKAFVVFDL